MFKPKLSEYTAKALADRTVEVRTGMPVESVSPTQVTLKSGDVLRAHTLVWGAGLQGNELITFARARAAARQPDGRRPDLTLPGHPEVFVVGDVAAITDAKTDTVLPNSGRSPSSRVSTRARRSRTGSRGRRPSRSPTRTRARWRRSAGALRSCRCSAGRTMTGKKAQLAWGTVHLALLPTNYDRAKAMVSWAACGDDPPARRADHRGTRLDVRCSLLRRPQAARSQMAFTLGFHIILASLGVALPAIMLIANYRGLRRDDPTHCGSRSAGRRWWR